MQGMFTTRYAKMSVIIWGVDIVMEMMWSVHLVAVYLRVMTHVGQHPELSYSKDFCWKKKCFYKIQGKWWFLTKSLFTGTEDFCHVQMMCLYSLSRQSIQFQILHRQYWNKETWFHLDNLPQCMMGDCP